MHHFIQTDLIYFDCDRSSSSDTM